MSVTTISDNLEFQAKVKFFGLSQLPGDKDNYLTTSILGGWTVAAGILKDAPSDVLAWLGPEASGFGLALSGFGFQDPQAKP